jgi:L-rhamnose mutarotase
MRNFSIFLRELDNVKYYLFSYDEYDGTDYEGDTKRLAAEPRNKARPAVRDRMQIPFPGQSGWVIRQEVYHQGP